MTYAERAEEAKKLAGAGERREYKMPDPNRPREPLHPWLVGELERLGWPAKRVAALSEYAARKVVEKCLDPGSYDTWQRAKFDNIQKRRKLPMTKTVKTPKTSKPTVANKRVGVGALISELIVANKTLEEIATAVKAKFPESKANDNLEFHVKWYAAKLKRGGKAVGPRWQLTKKPAAPAKKAAPAPAKKNAKKAAPAPATAKVATAVKKATAVSKSAPATSV